MALVLKDRVLETTTTTGTGSLTLDGAPSCYQSFNAAIGVGNTTYYAIFSTVADQWETGLGTLSSSNVLARTTIYESSNGGAAVNFTAGTKNVFVTFPASQSLVAGSVAITGGSINGTTIGNSTPSTGAFTTLSASSTVSGLGFSNYLASPPAIGSSAANTGAFTSLSASGTVSGTGFSNYLASPPAIGGSTPAAGTFTTLKATSVDDTSVLASSTGRTSTLTFVSSTTPTTGGVTLANQVAEANSVWLVKIIGAFTAVSSATVRTANIAIFWGSTQIVVVSPTVQASTAKTTSFMVDVIITGVNTTSVYATLNALQGINTSTGLPVTSIASTTVTAGAQTIDARFSTSVAVGADSWAINNVVITRVK